MMMVHDATSLLYRLNATYPVRGDRAERAGDARGLDVERELRGQVLEQVALLRGRGVGRDGVLDALVDEELDDLREAQELGHVDDDPVRARDGRRRRRPRQRRRGGRV